MPATPIRKSVVLKLVLVLGLVAGLAIGAWALFAPPREDVLPPATLEEIETGLKADSLKELSPEERAAKLNQYGRQVAEMARKDGPRMMGNRELRKAVRSMDQKDRRAFMDPLRKMFMERMRQRVADYFAASEAERVALLDKTLDRFKQFSAMRKARRAEREASGEPRPPRRPRTPPSTEQMTDRLSSIISETSPTERAQMLEYSRQLMLRAEETGVDLPFGRGGGPFSRGRR